MKNIGVLGLGLVTRSLTESFLNNGYEAMLVSREPSKLNAWKEEPGEKTRIGNHREVSAYD